MSIFLVLIISFFLISIPSTILHFTHQWFKHGILLHTFSAVNESTWEHMKLYVGPSLIALIFQLIAFNGSYTNIFNAMVIIMTIEIFGVPIMYEPLKRVVKNVPFVLTIVIFYVSVLVALITEYFLLVNNIQFFSEPLAFILILTIPIVFGVFTFYPPKFLLFKDPITKSYGDKFEK